MTRRILQTVCAAAIAVGAAAGTSAEAATPPVPPAAPATKPAAPQAAPLVAPVTVAGVHVKVKVIHAQRSGQFIDQHARKIEKLLKPLFNFASYRMVRREVVTLPHAVSTRIPMPFRVGVHLKQEGLQDKKILLGVQIGQKQSVKLRLEDGGTFLQGVTLKNGQNYILAISASTRPFK